jgi:hypothetical protein
MTFLKIRTLALALAASLALAALPQSAVAHPNDPSAASALSLMLPVAVSVTAPVAILSAGAMLSVVAVEASTAGTVWVLERASDSGRASVQFAGHAGQAVSTGIGTALVVTVLSAGCVLSAAGQAIAFIPNQIGAALFYNERITR